MWQMLIPKILRYASKDVRHVERRETSPKCRTVLIPEIPHHVRDDEVFIDVCPYGVRALRMTGYVRGTGVAYYKRTSLNRLIKGNARVIAADHPDPNHLLQLDPW
ncbi:hypothetical protein BN59_01307 [Legionella massiliensis]|uniref:Uncharacterized protein n=1 Tax=Legionella massiliensis TaxID=1034943 RepID=A0A078KZ80_9GAMM|nr:hypothetical protein BN59_01307 [Legionella massiliensis]CEE12766.1 hypothetical protein BN1094_01307 [Legionella massiliensis]